MHVCAVNVIDFSDVIYEAPANTATPFDLELRAARTVVISLHRQHTGHAFTLSVEFRGCPYPADGNACIVHMHFIRCEYTTALSVPSMASRCISSCPAYSSLAVQTNERLWFQLPTCACVPPVTTPNCRRQHRVTSECARHVSVRTAAAVCQQLATTLNSAAVDLATAETTAKVGHFLGEFNS